MGLSYSDLMLVRLIQKRQRIALSKVAAQLEKNETSIRRIIESCNLYSPVPLVRIEKGFCVSQVSYEAFVKFIHGISMSDYSSSYKERIRVMIVAIFFEGYVNASRLYESWGLSLTTKKQDTAHLRSFLRAHGLKLVTRQKKGLSIEGDDLQLRFLVIDILHPLLEFTAENHIEARLANTPIENQSWELARGVLSETCQEAVKKLNGFLQSCSLSLNYPSKKFLLLFICFMISRPVTEDTPLSYRLPFAPLSLSFTGEPRQDKLYSAAISMMNFSKSLDFPFDSLLWHTTERFAESVSDALLKPFPVREELLLELYGYFYREITLDHFHCTFVDKTVEDTDEQFPILYGLIEKYLVYFKAAFHFRFMDEHISTLTLLVQKHIIRNQVAERERKRIVIMTSINFERVSFFLEQLKDQISLEWRGTFNINEIHMLDRTDYDCILCFSSRIFNILNAKNLPVIRLNFFITSLDIERLLAWGFTPLRHRFLTSSFVLELAGKSETEMADYLRKRYGDYFV